MGAHRDPFLAALPGSLRPQAERWADLDAQLQQLVDASRRDDVASVEDTAFLAYLAERMPEDAPVAEALTTVRAADLRLAWACAAEHPGAAQTFRAELQGAAAAAAARAVSGDLVDEVVQETMTKLLVRNGDTPPTIAKYSGRGRLSKWVQTVALRVARTRTRKRSEEPADNVEILADRMLEVGDPELEAIKRTYRAQFKLAFRAALDGLSPRQRNLLRLELIDRATIDSIAKIHGVHPATISRWRADTRTRLLKDTRRAFERDLKVGRDEFHSIMRLIQSQLDVSLPRLLLEDESER